MNSVSIMSQAGLNFGEGVPFDAAMLQGVGVVSSTSVCRAVVSYLCLAPEGLVLDSGVPSGADLVSHPVASSFRTLVVSVLCGSLFASFLFFFFFFFFYCFLCVYFFVAG